MIHVMLRYGSHPPPSPNSLPRYATAEPEEMEVLQPILGDFGDVSSLRVNTSKTFALPLGGWDKERVRLPLPYVEKV